MSPSALSRQDRVFLRRGLMHGAWVRSGSEDGWVPPTELWERSGFSAPTFYNPPLYSAEVMEGLADPTWALAKGPQGNHLEAPPAADQPLLPPEARAHAEHLFTACFGDEEEFSEQGLAWLVEYYARMHRDHPDVLVHNNQAIGQYPDAEMRRYIREASPDLLTFDHYYFHEAVQYPGGSCSLMYEYTARYRRLALEGQHGDGAEPLAFGQYTTGFKLYPDLSPDGTRLDRLRALYVSESQQSVVSHVTWALGGKWLELFRWEHGPAEATIHTDGHFLNRPDGSPTPQLDRYARLNATRRAYSPYLVRLRTHAVGLDRGIDAATGQAVPANAELADFSASTDPASGVVGLDARNLGTANGGRRGDVVFGSFRAIPQLSEQENAGVLPDHADATAFMLVNGLVWRNDDWDSPDGTGGDGDDTAQVITVVVDRAGLTGAAADARLLRVDPDTGQSHEVELSRGEDGLETFDVRLRGGESGLYYWG